MSTPYRRPPAPRAPAPPRRRARTASLLLPAVGLLLAAAGCQDATGPGSDTDFDAAAALEAFEVMDGILSGPAWTGLGTLGAGMSAAGGPALGAGAGGLASLLPEVARLRVHPATAGSAAGELAGLGTPAGAPIISDTHRGRTFVWDPDAGHYVVDPDRTGAPATGVRFIVYDESAPGVPDPDREIGYADLVDGGDGSAEDVVLRLELVLDGVEVLRYDTRVDLDGSRIVVEVEGFLQDREVAADRLDFDLRVEGPVDGVLGTADMEFRMAVESRDFEIEGEILGADGEGNGDTDLRVRHGDDSLRVDVESSPSSLAGTIWLGDEVFATVAGTPDDPSFTGAGGDPLTGHEVAVLLRVVAVVVDVLVLFHGLLAPVAGIVGLGLIL